jgi:Holliday junction resolvase RusA-like endonuclease
MRFPVIVDDSGQAGKDWRGDVKRFALEAYQGAPLIGGLAVQMSFKLPRPKAHFHADGRLRKNAPVWHTTKPDALKMARAVEDALTGIVWKDDAIICVEILEKIYSATPGVDVTVQPAAGNDLNDPTTNQAHVTPELL